jgi:hypothetical protein
MASGTWAQFTVPFASMTQENWGTKFPNGPELTKVIGFQFQVGKNAFDYSVDNFELYK